MSAKGAQLVERDKKGAESKEVLIPNYVTGDAGGIAILVILAGTPPLGQALRRSMLILPILRKLVDEAPLLLVPSQKYTSVMCAILSLMQPSNVRL